MLKLLFLALAFIFDWVRFLSWICFGSNSRLRSTEYKIENIFWIYFNSSTWGFVVLILCNESNVIGQPITALARRVFETFMKIGRTHCRLNPEISSYYAFQYLLNKTYSLKYSFSWRMVIIVIRCPRTKRDEFVLKLNLFFYALNNVYDSHTSVKYQTSKHSSLKSQPRLETRLKT